MLSLGGVASGTRAIVVGVLSVQIGGLRYVVPVGRVGVPAMYRSCIEAQDILVEGFNDSTVEESPAPG